MPACVNDPAFMWIGCYGGEGVGMGREAGHEGGRGVEGNSGGVTGSTPSFRRVLHDNDGDYLE